ncbi:MAG TPA: response regulator, partial [Rhodocyclaceae bacterium]
REVRSAASGRAALEALAHGATDALVIGPALGDMTTVELIRTISGEGLGGADLPLAIIEGPAAPLAVTVEIGMLRARARLEDILDATARHLARCVGDAGAARRSRAPQHRAAAGELAGRKALIVDDDVYNVYAVTAALEQAGMTVLPAETAREGIEALRAHPDADIVLIDISMPEIDGDSVIHALRATHERALPVIAVTPRAMPGDREKCLVAGASDYVSKPVNVEQLLATVRHWLATT